MKQICILFLIGLWCVVDAEGTEIEIRVRSPQGGAHIWTNTGNGFSDSGNYGDDRFFGYKNKPVGSTIRFLAKYQGKTCEKQVTIRNDVTSYTVEFKLGDFSVGKVVSSELNLARLKRAIESAKSQYKEIDFISRYRKAKTDLELLIDQHAAVIPRAVRSAVRWDELVEALKDNKFKPRVFWLTYLGDWYKNIKGFEAKPFKEVRKALSKLSNAALYVEYKDFGAVYFKTLDKLTKGTERLVKTPESALAYAEVVESLELLGRTGLVEDLLKTYYAEFPLPNSLFEVSHPYVASAFTKTHAPNVQGISENILGAHISGTSQNNGQTRAYFVRGEPARVRIEYNGTGRVSSTGTKSKSGPLGFRTYTGEVPSSGIQSHRAYGEITLHSNRIVKGGAYVYPVRYLPGTFRSGPPQVSAVNWRGRRRRVGRLAYNKAVREARRNQAQTVAIGLQRATDTLGRKFSTQFSNAVQNFKYDEYMDKYKKPLTRLGAVPYKMRWACPTSQSLVLKQWRGHIGQLDAASSPPNFGSQYDVRISWHQSDFNNLARNLRGAVARYENLIYDPAEFDDIDKLNTESLARKWDMIFDPWRPKLIEFGKDGSVSIELNLSEFRIQKTTELESELIAFQTPVKVRASYKVRAPNLKAKEKGPVGNRKSFQIQYLDKSFNKEGEHSKLVALFEQSMRGLLREKFEYEKVIGPIDQELGKINLGKLQKVYLKSVWVSKGWMVFGLNR